MLGPRANSNVLGCPQVFLAEDLHWGHPKICTVHKSGFYSRVCGRGSCCHIVAEGAETKVASRTIRYGYRTTTRIEIDTDISSSHTVAGSSKKRKHSAVESRDKGVGSGGTVPASIRKNPKRSFSVNDRYICISSSPRFVWEKTWIPACSIFSFPLLPSDARIPLSIKHL